ncbi:FAD:protein FMN transferase [Nocardia sp. NPDC088792]|uniref:FAD:protein FMN transferase n=1 Tax=Nocardia sp. NPDC088792 TaxID=3364332 RepID=UPI00382EF2DE
MTATTRSGRAVRAEAGPDHVAAAEWLRPDWTSILMRERVVAVPARVVLDLGATAKALAADRCAALVDEHCGCGVLVNLGGDIATAGPAPAGGWQVLVPIGNGSGSDGQCAAYDGGSPAGPDNAHGEDQS